MKILFCIGWKWRNRKWNNKWKKAQAMERDYQQHLIRKAMLDNKLVGSNRGRRRHHGSNDNNGFQEKG